METVGSKPTKLTPEKWTRKGEPQETFTTSLFVSINRNQLNSWSQSLPHWTLHDNGANELPRIEQFNSIEATDRIKPIITNLQEPLLEIVLHTTNQRGDDYILQAFEDYVSDFEIKPNYDKRFYAGGLCFFPLKGMLSNIHDIAKFSFLRAIRLMPQLRPITRSIQNPKKISCYFPDEPPVNPSLRAAVFDGGTLPDSEIKSWVDCYEPTDIGKSCDEYLHHGHAVSSALLFGSLQDGKIAPVPYGKIDHYRVLDEKSHKDPYELYDVSLLSKIICDCRLSP